jgi:AraC-like DNA-binding protein
MYPTPPAPRTSRRTRPPLVHPYPTTPHRTPGDPSHRSSAAALWRACRPTPPPAPVVTMLTPDERLRVDAAGDGVYATVHRETLDDIVRELRTRPLSAVLVSAATLAHCGGQGAARVAEIVRDFPRVPTLALVCDPEVAPHVVLALGRSGVRSLIDARRPDGWRALRHALAGDGMSALEYLAATMLASDLEGAPQGCVRFFAALFATGPAPVTVRALATTLGVLPTTLMSRFFRLRLPPPKRYLALARLTRAARLLENAGCSLTSVAHHLDYSSAQSFGRHVRTLLGVTAAEFRRRYDGETAFQRFREDLVLPHLDVLRNFSPLGKR